MKEGTHPVTLAVHFTSFLSSFVAVRCCSTVLGAGFGFSFGASFLGASFAGSLPGLRAPPGSALLALDWGQLHATLRKLTPGEGCGSAIKNVAGDGAHILLKRVHDEPHEGLARDSVIERVVVRAGVSSAGQSHRQSSEESAPHLRMAPFHLLSVADSVENGLQTRKRAQGWQNTHMNTLSPARYWCRP